ncbi:MAG: RnfH family protein [Wenzhouxiangella sp.]
MADALLQVEVAAALPERQIVMVLALPVGATVKDALAAADIGRLLPEFDQISDRVGIFGRLCTLDRPLQPGDRVELYRPLKADPKEVRRQLAELERAGGRAAREP